MKDAKIFVLTILHLCMIAIIVIIGVGAYNSYTELQEECDQLRQENAQYFQSIQEDFIIINDWYTEDGYTDCQEWWEAYKARKAELSNLKDKVVNSESAGYATEEQLKQLESLDNRVKEARSIKELDKIAEEFGSIASTLLEAQSAAEAAAAAPYSYSYSGGGSSYDTPSGGLTMQSGVNYYDGRTETYYSSNVAYHYRTSEWTVDSEGFYRDSDGYYVVAASDRNEGDTYEGSKGQVRVYDGGCDEGVTDYYVAW